MAWVGRRDMNSKHLTVILGALTTGSVVCGWFAVSSF